MVRTHGTFLRNDGIRLHVIDHGSEHNRHVPLLIVPGMAESADDYADLIAHLAPRRCVAVTLRGRGRSDAPPSGYALADHVGDIATGAALFDGPTFCLFAFSRGVAYGVGYAVRDASRLAGLILGDYPAVHSALPPAFPAGFLAGTWRGRPAAERIAGHAVRGIQQEAERVVFWDALETIDCPSLILHGAAAKGSLLPDADLERYRRHLRDLAVTNLPEAGHDLRSPDPVPFHAAIRGFLETLDAARP